MKDLSKLEISEYFQILWKRRWYFLIVAIIGISGGAFYSWRSPDVFKSETRIMVDTPQVLEDFVRSSSRATPEDRINSIRQQLASRTFLEQMIEQFQMYGYGTRSEFVMENAVRLAQKQIGIERTSDNTFTVSFIATDPHFAQTVTRQLAGELIRISTRFKTDKAVATDQFVNEQLRQSAEALKAQEDKIKQFRLAHLGALPENGNANVNSLPGLYSQLTSAENAVQQVQDRQKSIDFNYQERKRLNLVSQRVAGRDNAPAIAENGEPASPEEVEFASKKRLLAQYMTKYTASHPDVVTLTRDIARLELQLKDKKAAGPTESTAIAGTTAGVSQEGRIGERGDSLETDYKFQSDSIKAEIGRREKDKQVILQQIKLYQEGLKLAPALEQELAVLMRDREVLREQNENLQRQRFNTQMAASVATDQKSETYRIIDEANLPVKAESPNRLQIVMIGIVAGLALGLGAAFGREVLDSTIGSEEEAKRLLSLPVLVSIPTVPNENKKTA